MAIMPSSVMTSRPSQASLERQHRLPLLPALELKPKPYSAKSYLATISRSFAFNPLLDERSRTAKTTSSLLSLATDGGDARSALLRK